MRTWTLASAVAAPVVLAGGSVLAQSDQPPGYSAVHSSISQLAAYGAAQRCFMTATLALVRACYLVTAIGMTALNLVGRVLLIAGGVATSVVAALPQPNPAHVPVAGIALSRSPCGRARAAYRRRAWVGRPRVSRPCS